MIMMPYGWTLDIAAAHRSGRLLAPHRRRLAYGFRNPLNQWRRVRNACTRGYRADTTAGNTPRPQGKQIR